MSDAATVPRQGVLTGPAERRRVIALLRALEDRLRRRGVVRLRLFGSVARGEADLLSDVDLLAEIDRAAVPEFSLLDLVGLELELGERLGRAVQIATAPAKLHPRVRARVERDALEVFG